MSPYKYPFMLVFFTVCFSSSWPLYSNMYPSYHGITKVWIKKTPQSWRDWNTRISLGHINFPTNLELPLAVPGSDGKSWEIIIPMDDVVNDEEFVLSPSTPSCPKDGTNILFILFIEGIRYLLIFKKFKFVAVANFLCETRHSMPFFNDCYFSQNVTWGRCAVGKSW